LGKIPLLRFPAGHDPGFSSPIAMAKRFDNEPTRLFVDGGRNRVIEIEKDRFGI